MSQIAREAEARQTQEARDHQHRLFLGKVRSVFIFLFIATLFVLAFSHTEAH